jgi:hypothetical protein
MAEAEYRIKFELNIFFSEDNKTRKKNHNKTQNKIRINLREEKKVSSWQLQNQIQQASSINIQIAFV